jgi:hypothetical protein
MVVAQFKVNAHIMMQHAIIIRVTLTITMTGGMIALKIDVAQVQFAITLLVTGGTDMTVKC